jgi:eukaryotic-like serine/threonine-protein kinase
MIGQSWEFVEGTVLDEKYPLKRCISAQYEKAVFLTSLEGEPPRKAAVKLVRGEAAEETLSRWSLAQGLSHPHLVRIIATGQTEAGGGAVAYAVMDYADDDLAGVLRERPLTADEAFEALSNTLDALAYLHGKGMVHGHIKPANIMSVEETIKISSDGLRRAANGEASPASDIWCLGGAIFEMLTQRAPAIDSDGAIDPRELFLIPERFREIVRHALQPAPQDRWTVAQIRESLTRPLLVPFQNEPTQEAKFANIWRSKWFYFSAVVCGILVAMLLTRSGNRRPPAAAHPTPAPAVATTPPVQTQPATPPPQAAAPAVQESPKPTPFKPAKNDSRAVWRLVVYAYNDQQSARNKARTITAKYPRFKADVFTVTGRNQRYLVTIGGRMTREAAVDLMHAATRAGLPRDMYVQNYSH